MTNLIKNFFFNFDKNSSWHSYNYGGKYVYFRGYLNNVNARDFLEKFTHTNFNDIKNLLNLLDGHFSLICITNDYAFACVDRIRSYPVLWTKMDNELIVSDKSKSLLKYCKDIDLYSVKSFSLSGYTIGDKTLYANIKQLKPGNFIWFEDDEIIEDRYNDWRLFEKTKYNKSFSDLNLVNENILKKLIKSANGRQIVVPLSAGMDSRFIASGLRHFNYMNVICVSYGIKNNKDAFVAKEIAEKLNYDWIFIKYSSSQFSKAFQSEDYKKYVDYCDSLTSIHFAGEYLMLASLKNNKKINKDAIFVNGQSGDFISGNHMPNELVGLDKINKLNDELFYKLYLKKHYKHWKETNNDENKAIIISLLKKELEGLKEKNNFNYASAYEYMEFIDRQSKYVINGQRTYEYFGYDWRLPLWDNDYLNFWANTENKNKINQNLYINTLKKYNWCGVWKEIDINPKIISPSWIIPVRFILKTFFYFFGKKNWYEFERKYLDYFMTTTCCYGPWPYLKIVFDKRGHDSPIGWIIEHYLNLKNINWKGEPIDK